MALACAGIACADTISFSAHGANTGNNNDAVSAWVTFSTGADCSTAGGLCITVYNTTLNGTPNIGDVLTGIVFDVSNGSAFNTPMSSATGTTVYYANGSTTTQTGVNLVATNNNKGSYEFLEAPGGKLSSTLPYNYGIATTTMGTFDPNIVQKTDYSIVAAGTNLGAGGSGLANLTLVQTSATFVLTGAQNFNLDLVNSVAFTFGSNPSGNAANVILGGHHDLAPEPSTAGLLLIGVAALFAARWRLRRSRSETRN